MKNNRFLSGAAAIVFAVTALCGCSKSTDNSSDIPTIDVGNIELATPSKITNSNNSGIISSENPTSETRSNSDQSTENGSAPLPGESSGGMVIDADVSVPSGGSYGEYYVWETGYTEEKAFKIMQRLLGKTDVQYSVFEYDSGDIYHFEEGDLSITIDERYSRIGLNTDLSLKIRNLFEQPRPEETTNIGFFEQRDLDFATRADTVKNIKEMLSNLGVDVCDDPAVYTLDEKGLEKAMDEFEKEHPNNSYEYMPSAPYKNFECYYIEFNAKLGGVPIYNQFINYKTLEGFMLNPEITAIVSAEGLKYLSICYLPQKTELKTEVTKMISAQDAAAVAAENYAYSKYPVNINKISLMYINTILEKSERKGKEGAVKMIPVWVCSGTVVREYDMSKRGGEVIYREEGIDIYIDAVTGKEIVL